MARTPKTPRQRAEEALGIEDRRVTKLTKQRDHARTKYEALEHDLTASTARRDFLAKSPDLPQPTPPATKTAAKATPPRPSRAEAAATADKAAAPQPAREG